MDFDGALFGDLVRANKLAVGDGYRAKNDELGAEGPIFLRAAYLQDAGFVIDLPDRLSNPLTSNFGPKRAIIGDTVLTTKSNSLGRLGRINGEIVGAIYSPHLSYWRSIDRTAIDPGYLYYWACSPACAAQIHAMAYSTDMAPYLSLGDQLRLRIHIPHISRQRAIASILGALDDKIELNRKMSATLEAMARAIFKSWFVDFDPVRAKAEGRRPESMDEATAALFPDRFGEDGLPKGWRQEPLDKLAVFLNGLALQKYPPTGSNDLPVIKIAQLRAGSAEGADLSSGNVPTDYIVRDGDLLFSWSGSLIQRVWTAGTGALNQHLFKVTPINRPKWLCYLWIDYHLPEFQAIAASKATTMGHIQRHHLREANCILPPGQLLKQVDRIVEPLFQRSVACALESRTLAGLRDTLS